jgi:hypothetical protein
VLREVKSVLRCKPLESPKKVCVSSPSSGKICTNFFIDFSSDCDPVRSNPSHIHRKPTNGWLNTVICSSISHSDDDEIADFLGKFPFADLFLHENETSFGFFFVYLLSQSDSMSGEPQQQLSHKQVN